jgi:predicted N-acyltransferase
MADTYKIFSEKNNNLDRAEAFYGQMDQACIYNFPIYLNILSDYLYEDIELNIFALESENGKIFYPFFKRSLKDIPLIPREFHKYHDIIGSRYYGGPMVSVQKKKETLVKAYEKAFSHYCAKENIIAEFVRFDPNIQNHLYFDEYYDIKFNRETVHVNLDQEYTSIWNGYKGRCRTAIRKATKNNIVVSEEISPDRIDSFAKIYQAEMERKADSKHYFFSTKFFHRMIEIMSDNFKFFFAFHDDTMCGGTIVYCKDNIAYDFLMATHMDFWKFQPNNILLDSAIKWSKSNGFQVFDLMGGRKGVFKFKSSFSDMRQKFFIGKKTHNDSIYSRLEKVTLNLTEEKYNADFFPVYRQLEAMGDI